MATHKHPVPGGETLKQQENRLIRMEELTFAKVIKYAEVSGTANNEAELEHVARVDGSPSWPIHSESPVTRE